MNSLNYPYLKNATFICNHYPDKPKVKRYVVENKNDLNKFLKVFPNLKSITSVVETLKKYLKEGKTIILTDNTIAGLPSYCFAGKEFERI